MATLLDNWLDALGRMMTEWEEKGEWPEALKHVIFSMIPEPKAEHEAGLRPIGLLPYVYRAWMAICKGQAQQRQWPLGIHDAKHAGAATMAARARVCIEVAQHQGNTPLLAFWTAPRATRELATHSPEPELWRAG